VRNNAASAQRPGAFEHEAENGVLAVSSAHLDYEADSHATTQTKQQQKKKKTHNVPLVGKPGVRDNEAAVPLEPLLLCGLEDLRGENESAF
jgi:hypothetical protein